MISASQERRGAYRSGPLINDQEFSRETLEVQVIERDVELAHSYDEKTILMPPLLPASTHYGFTYLRTTSAS